MQRQIFFFQIYAFYNSARVFPIAYCKHKLLQNNRYEENIYFQVIASLNPAKKIWVWFFVFLVFFVISCFCSLRAVKRDHNLAANNLQRAAFFSEEFNVKVHVTVRSSIPGREYNRSKRLPVTRMQAGKVNSIYLSL